MTRHRPVAGAVIVVCALVLSALALHAQAQRPTFRGGTDLVQLDVVVLDKDRHPVTDLTSADFIVLDQGKPRPIQAFAPVTLLVAAPAPPPRGAAWTRLVADDVITNQRAEDGRLVVIMMDMSIPAGGMTAVARRVAHAAVDALGADDLAAVVGSSTFAGDGTAQGFTTDHQRLNAVIDAPFMGLTKRPPNGPSNGIDNIPTLDDSISCHCGICQWEAITRVANALRAEARRQKVVLFIARDLRVQASAFENSCAFEVRYARERAFRALDRANAVVHSIDPSGLETLAATASGGTRASADANLARQGRLAVIADYTGGRTIMSTNDPDRVVPDLFRETAAYYAIGIPRVERGRYSDERRNIRVRVKGRDDLIVRARTGYYAASPGDTPPPRDPAEASVGGLLPKSDVPLRVGLTPRFRSDGHVEVGVLLGAGDAGRDASMLNVLVGVFDEKAWPITNARHMVELPAIGETQTRPAAQLPPLDLKPGRYEVRIGVERQGDGATGSVYGYVDVPDVDHEPLALSGVTLQALPRPASDVALALAPLLTMPTLRRTFTAGDVVTAFVQLRVRDQKDRFSLTLRARIVNDQDRVALDVPIDVAGALFDEYGNADAAVGVPVARLAPDKYLLTIEAVVGDVHQRRDVPFEVR